MLRHHGLVPLFVALIALAPRAVHAQHAPLPTQLVALDSPEGERLLLGANAREDFFPLIENYVSQEHGSYCGVASATMVLNALQLPAPRTVSGWGAYGAFTQDNVFTDAVRRVVTPNDVQHGGLTLDQLAAMLDAFPTRARAVHASDTTLDEFRRTVVENLGQRDNFVLLNYQRSELGQESSGHISPVGAYNADSDRFLILDVARYKYPPVWATAADVFRAISTQDPATERSRGFVLVSLAPGAHAAVGPVPPHFSLPKFVYKIGAALISLGMLLGALLTFFVMRRRRPRAA